jgi:hypothetical protein
LEQHVCREIEALAEAPDHLDAEPALTVHDLVDTGARPDVGLEILAGETALLHDEFQKSDRVRGLYGIVLVLVSADEYGEDLQELGFRRPVGGIDYMIDLGERRAIIFLVPDWSNCDFIHALFLPG